MSDTPQKPSDVWLPRCGVCAATALLVLVFLLAWYRFVQASTSFNSDQLYCLHFCDDFVHGRDLRGWHLPAAPYLFPDMVLLSGLLICTSNLSAVYGLYLAVHYAFTLGILTYVLSLVGVRIRSAYLTACLGVMLFLAASLHPDYEARNLLWLHPGNHVGCLLVGLGAVALVLRALKYGYRWASSALVLIICALGSLSDQLLIVQFLVPICAAVLLLSLFKLIPKRRAAWTIGLLGLSALLGMTKQIVLTRLGLIPMNFRPSYRTPDLFALKTFFRLLWRSTQTQPLLVVILVLHVAGILAVLTIWTRRYRRNTESPRDSSDFAGLNGPATLLVALVLLMAPLVNAGALIVNNMVHPATLDRYLYTWFVLPFLCVALWPQLIPSRRLARLVPVAIVALVAFRLVQFPDAIAWDRFSPRYPPLAQALDAMVRKHGKIRGFAEYWRAREMRYLTREHVEVLPILPWGLPWFHGFNPHCFLFEDRHDLLLPDYHFIILPTKEEAGPDPGHIAARFGKPTEIIPVEGYEIWRYERLMNRQLELFLRAQLAQRLVEEKAFIAPLEPRALAAPKRNLTPWNARGNVQLKSDASLAIHFDRPATGRMIDFAANFADEYQLRFLRAGKDIAATHVSAVEWTGAEIAYCEPGMQSRLIEVPSACFPDGFDEVRVLPRGRSPHFALGHFLVFDEWIPYRSPRTVPGDRYHRYEGEQLARTDATNVTTIRDPSASGGQARQADASFQGYAAFGPYVPLAPGRYRVDFALKIADNSSADTVAVLDSYAFGGQQCLHVRDLKGVDFSKANEYRVFSFTLETDDELDLVEYRLIVAGKTTVTLDYVEVTRLDAAKTSEACEP